MGNEEAQFEDIEFRIGNQDVTGHTATMGRITVNQPCHHFEKSNSHRVQVLFCSQLMEGRYVTAQALED